MSENQKFFALLIDGDNAQSALIPEILDKLSKYGEPLISRVFHNKTTIEQWEQIASKYPIEPIWVPNNTKNKNSVDIALVMAAMIILYERSEITGFCLVASDGDYTRLARHLKSQGKFVLGIGEKKTPEPFVVACTKFIDIEDLVTSDITSKQFTDASEELSSPTTNISDNDFLKLFIKAHKQCVKKNAHDKQDLITLRETWEAMKELDAAFSFEYQQILKFVNKVKALAKIHPDNLELEEQPDSKPTVHYVRIKLTKSKKSGEFTKFRKVYIHAVDVLNFHIDGWVTLSTIGEVLQKLYPNYERYVYDGEKYEKLKPVVEKMASDYPNVIELENIGTVLQMRFMK